MSLKRKLPFGGWKLNKPTLKSTSFDPQSNGEVHSSPQQTAKRVRIGTDAKDNECLMDEDSVKNNGGCTNLPEFPGLKASHSPVIPQGQSSISLKAGTMGKEVVSKPELYKVDDLVAIGEVNLCHLGPFFKTKGKGIVDYHVSTWTDDDQACLEATCDAELMLWRRTKGLFGCAPQDLFPPGIKQAIKNQEYFYYKEESRRINNSTLLNEGFCKSLSEIIRLPPFIKNKEYIRFALLTVLKARCGDKTPHSVFEDCEIRNVFDIQWQKFLSRSKEANIHIDEGDQAHLKHIVFDIWRKLTLHYEFVDLEYFKRIVLIDHPKIIKENGDWNHLLNSDLKNIITAWVQWNKRMGISIAFEAESNNLWDTINRKAKSVSKNEVLRWKKDWILAKRDQENGDAKNEAEEDWDQEFGEWAGIEDSPSTEFTNDDDDPSNQSQKLTSDKSNRQITVSEAVNQFFDSLPEPPSPPSPQLSQRMTSERKQSERGEIEVGSHATYQDDTTPGIARTPSNESSKVHSYVSILPHDNRSHHKWIDNSGAIAKREAEALLNVHFEIQFQRNVKFQIRPKLAKGKNMTADSEEAKTTLARAHDFVQFWIWYYKGKDCSPGTKQPLKKCLEWFKNPNDGYHYNQYLKDRALQSLPDT
ncbi:hypothetical protein BGAL_0849g00020 [Botrytis galanthina]|uniref:Uncharacterized protein n=1 Tax=Botrytis galanthina TaxID=278940 RepID=A0A4S8QGR0_9HELO|nr:hypothetical protein BGAL_0849g00020 [Botrytis galanthina]